MVHGMKCKDLMILYLIGHLTTFRWYDCLYYPISQYTSFLAKIIFRYWYTCTVCKFYQYYVLFHGYGKEGDVICTGSTNGNTFSVQSYTSRPIQVISWISFSAFMHCIPILNVMTWVCMAVTLEKILDPISPLLQKKLLSMIAELDHSHSQINPMATIASLMVKQPKKDRYAHILHLAVKSVKL